MKKKIQELNDIAKQKSDEGIDKEVIEILKRSHDNMDRCRVLLKQAVVRHEKLLAMDHEDIITYAHNREGRL